MKTILNSTKSSRNRYTLIEEGMGGADDPYYYPTHKYSVVNGIDRGNGYQGYMSITYFIKDASYVSEEAVNTLKVFLQSLGYEKYLKEIGA